MHLNLHSATMVHLLSDAYVLLRFIAGKTGKEYAVGHLEKLKLAVMMIRNNRRINSQTMWQQHLLMIEDILGTPKSLEGDIVECGCYDGASTVSLSLACALVNRKLIVCDSFAGLPEPRDDEKCDIHAHSVDYYVWEEGEYCSERGLEGVIDNVKKFGNIRSCEFVKGYFLDTLKDIPTESVILIFEDADLASSVADCLRQLWPKLQNGCKFYCHEPWSIQVVSLFFNEVWWRDNLGMHPPGFWGSGYGIRVGLRASGVGYARKFNPQEIKKRGKRIIHVGSKDLKYKGE